MKRIGLNYVAVGEGEREEIEEALGKREKERELEDHFRNYIGVPFAVATSNETAALHLAMTAIDLKRGDKILCSVNTFPNVPEVVRHFDAEPIFVDIDPEDYNIDLDELERILAKNRNKKLKGAIISHIAGQPTNLDRLYEMAEHYNIIVVEDGNDALGATYRGKKIGSLKGAITTFSFNPHKTSSLNNGGMLVTSSEDLEERARLLRANAMITNEWGEGELGYIYDVVDIGLEYDMGDLNAAFNLAQLKRNDAAIERRREIASIYYRELADVPHVELPTQREDHIFTKFIIKIDKNRDSFAKELYRRGIESGLHYIPLHLLSYYKQKYGLRVNDFPKALRNYQQVLSIPIHTGMDDEDVSYVVEQIREVAQSRG
ncbi:MAG: DegT/DnrJ/EryC1/StrS family aminotransferase [Epsilonproteobacteria bacterium]|nr:aminotransferase DegT [Campylobacterota bacterium]NPA57092.1 DegT/DnrJ/EryC1/StrS family aminotransferase [Campylobacterota bacterium]